MLCKSITRNTLSGKEKKKYSNNKVMSMKRLGLFCFKDMLWIDSWKPKLIFTNSKHIQ